LKEPKTIATRVKRPGSISVAKPMRFYMAVLLITLAISSQTFSQVRTTFKYSEDLERQVRVAKELHEQYKQFRKDSTKLVKQQIKDLKKNTDSLTTELKKQASVSNLQSISPELQEMTTRQQAARAAIDQKFRDTGKYTRISKKELQTMVLQSGKDLPELQQYRSMIDEELSPYKAQLDQYRHLPQSADSLKQQISDLDSAELWQQLDQMVESEVEKNNYYQAFMKEQGQLSKIQGNPTAMLQDNVPSFDFAEHPMKEARQAGMKHFGDISENIEEGKGQIDGLKKKYAYVPDSKDLSTAQKTSTLKGVPVKKRFVYGGDLHVDIGDPLFLDFNPMIGYRLDKRWMLGIGGMFRFRLSHTDSAGLEYRIPTTGGRGFGEYQFYKSFLAHAEYEVLTNDVFTKAEVKNTPSKPTQSINVGLGNTFNIYKGLKGKFLLLYNFALDGEKQYRSPWVIRFGFLN
jgi:cell division protein FtsB